MDNLFDFIRKYSLQFRSEVPDNLTCTICGNVLIDTHYSHCGCKFCKECIANYLSDGDKPCPSRKKTCTDAIFSLSTDVKKDPYSDSQIGNLLVTCPFDLCSHQCVMKMMPDHVRTCSKQPTVCDFNAVGCEEIMVGNEGLKNHLEVANVNHLRLLLTYLSNSGNDTQQQMDSVKRHLVDEQRTVNEIHGEIGKMKENTEREVIAIKDAAKLTTSNMWWMSSVIFAIAILFIALMISISRRVDTKETNIRMEIQHLKETLRNYEFVWRVNDLTKKRNNNEEIYSDYFYSHLKGYKIFLILYPNGDSTGKGTHLSFSFQIGKGDFDSSLQWPMNKRVWLAIVNQRTGSDHIKYDFHVKDLDPKYAYSFDRVYIFQTIGFGIPQFISWDDLQKSSDVLNNDGLLIRCTFTDW